MTGAHAGTGASPWNGDLPVPPAPLASGANSPGAEPGFTPDDPIPTLELSEPKKAVDPATTPVVALEQLERTFPGPPAVEALKGADLLINRGDYLALVGPSGSGKSTLLHLLGLLDRPTGGRYLLDGIDTNSLSEPQRAGLRAAHIGFVFQAFHLLAHRSNVENVMLSDVYRRGGRRQRRERAVAALEAVKLSHRLDGYPTTLSGGERQRVAIARALVSDPSLILADEPTGNLDTNTGEQILKLFADLHERGLTIVIITHDDEVAARADRVARIRDGHLEGGIPDGGGTTRAPGSMDLQLGGENHGPDGGPSAVGGVA